MPSHYGKHKGRGPTKSMKSRHSKMAKKTKRAKKPKDKRY